MVIRYAYLWRSEHDKGIEEGGKDRPCAVLLAVMDDAGDQKVVVLPITHSPPHDAAEAVEIPPATKRRLKLDDERSWIVLAEANRFTWPGPPPDEIRRHDHSFIWRIARRSIQKGEGTLACIDGRAPFCGDTLEISRGAAAGVPRRLVASSMNGFPPAQERGSPPLKLDPPRAPRPSEPVGTKGVPPIIDTPAGRRTKGDFITKELGNKILMLTCHGLLW